MYKKLRLLQLGEEIKSKKDPISRYNLVIEQYNDPVNRNQEIFLKIAHNNFFYKVWFALQSRCLFILLLLYFVPYLTLLTFLFNLFVDIVHEIAIITYKSNENRIKDPLQNMIYNQILCSRGSADYLYFEVNPENLDSFKFDVDVLKKIQDRYKPGYDRKLRFMVYNNPFLAGYQNLTKARYITFIHLLLNVVIFIAMQYYVYEPLFCFDMIHPLITSSDCQTN